MWCILVVFTICLGVCSSKTTITKWHSLKVKWGATPQDPGAFDQLPTTVSKALADGFTKISDCNVNAPWRGARYAKDGDHALILLFDVNKNIAGIQSKVPKNQPGGFPATSLRPPFVEDGDHWVISVYFTDPAKICSQGRSAWDIATYGVGSNLYIQNSTRPGDSILIPRNEARLANTGWTEGLCFPAMGTHYWWNMRQDTSCDNIFPVFLLYTGQELTGLGWAFITDLSSPRYEHPTPRSYKMFVKTVPTCLPVVGVTSTMHIFLTSQPESIKC